MVELVFWWRVVFFFLILLGDLVIGRVWVLVEEVGVFLGVVSDYVSKLKNILSF